MAKSKFKMTGFARFFIVMLILAPLAYIGASYANGEDGVENFKNLFKGKVSLGVDKIDDTPATAETTKTVEIPAPSSTSSDQSDSSDKDTRIRELQTQLDEKTRELEEVKAQLKAVQEVLKN